MKTLDELVGTSFGKKFKVTIVDTKKNKSNKLVALCRCEICSNDHELFSTPLFEASREQVRLNQVPCGCGLSYRWTVEQMEIRSRRLVAPRGYIFHKIESFKWNASRLHLECEKGHVWKTSRFDTIRNGVGCPRCYHERQKETVSIEADVIAKLKLIDQFKDYKFSRIVPGSWEITCMVCATDKFSLAGISDGVFKSSQSNLMAGWIPCRCSQKPKLSKELQEYHIKSTCQELGMSFKGWVNDYTDLLSKFIINCSTHECVTNVANFNSSLTKCPQCYKRGFQADKIGFLYILKIIGKDKNFTGYGITGNIKKRLKQHSSNLSKQGFQVVGTDVFKMPGEIALDIERKIKYSYATDPQQVDGFIREATLYSLHRDVVNYVINILIEEGYYEHIISSGEEEFEAFQ